MDVLTALEFMRRRAEAAGEKEDAASLDEVIGELITLRGETMDAVDGKITIAVKDYKRLFPDEQPA